VVQLDAASAVIECGGVGFVVLLTPAARASLRLDSEGMVLTTLVVREDSLTLYGFADRDEREVFTAVQGVSGVGPRIAMAVLGALTPARLRTAVAQEDLATLQTVPGIGRKGAQKMIIELAGKLGLGGAAGVVGGSGAGVSSEVVAALVGLGWREADAAAAVDQVVAAGDAPGEVGALLRAALKVLGGGARG
jgi:Holliday junction DNA helicase RuvA